MPGESGPGSAVCHDRGLMKFLFSPLGEVQLRTLISPPNVPLRPAPGSWGSAAVSSHPLTTSLLEILPWSTQQPSQIPSLWWP